MAVESGRVTSTREPVVSVRLNDAVAVECLVDTGFTGALMLPRKIVGDLGIPLVGREVFEMVGQRFFTASIALAEIDWLGQRRTFRVVISEGMDYLIGTEMLDGNRLFVDYINDRVIITNDRIIHQS
jgi:clan AA aspartic protease